MTRMGGCRCTPAPAAIDSCSRRGWFLRLQLDVLRCQFVGRPARTLLSADSDSFAAPLVHSDCIAHDALAAYALHPLSDSNRAVSVHSHIAM